MKRSFRLRIVFVVAVVAANGVAVVPVAVVVVVAVQDAKDPRRASAPALQLERSDGDVEAGRGQ